MGTNPVIGEPIKVQLEMLKTRLPKEFKSRKMDDLGCGDGKVTLLLKDIFQPSVLRGFDVHPGLVKRARDNGIYAEVKDLSTGLPTGELAVMWGVLHHLNNIEHCLSCISKNYQMAVIREPIKGFSSHHKEMGKPLVKHEIEQLAGKYFPGAELFYYGDCIFIFYISTEMKKVASKVQ